MLRLGLGAATATFAALAAVRLESEAGSRAGNTARPVPPSPPVATPSGSTPPASADSPSAPRPQRRNRPAATQSRTTTTDPGRTGSPERPSTTDTRTTATTVPPTTATTEPLTTEPPTTAATEPPTTSTTTPGQQPTPPSALQFFGPTAGRAVYLTIDDGWFPDPRVLDLVRAEQLPITTFLIRDAGDDDPEHFAFWRSFVDAGGQVQNHTVSHPWLTQLSPGQIEAQWEGASVAFRRWFGTRPTLGRPPYGAVDDAVWQAAVNAGLTSLVMWSAVDNGHGLQTWNHAPLAPGEIVLLHWDPGLYDELRQVLAAVEAAGLTPQFLPT